jgi:hypothetical protein
VEPVASHQQESVDRSCSSVQILLWCSSLSFYWVLEMEKWRCAWIMPVLVLGMNAICRIRGRPIGVRVRVQLHCERPERHDELARGRVGPSGIAPRHPADNHRWCIPSPLRCSAGSCFGFSDVNRSSSRSNCFRWGTKWGTEVRRRTNLRAPERTGANPDC